MDRDTIIDGLRMTMDLFVFDPSTGEERDPDELNDLDRATYDACKGALEILERLDTDSDTISRQAAIDALDEIEAEVAEGFGFEYEKWRKHFCDLPPAQPEIIYCKDCKKHNKHYHESPYKDTVCPLTAWRGKARGHEYDYQYCCYAERREVTT